VVDGIHGRRQQPPCPVLKYTLTWLI